MKKAGDFHMHLARSLLHLDVCSYEIVGGCMLEQHCVRNF